MAGMTHSKAWIKANGRLLQTLPGAKLDIGGNERAPVMGSNSIHGYSETLKPSMLTCELSLSEGVSLSELKDITGATVTYEADTGQTWVMRNAFVAKTLNITAGEGGKVALEFQGDPAEELA